MKVKSLCASVLVAALGMTLIANGTVEAASGNVGGSLDSKGTVEIIQGEVGGGEDTKDPEKPGSEVTVDPDEVTTNEDTGTLLIQAVSNLQFGTIETGTTAKTANAKAVTLTDKATSAAVTRGAYVQWSDIRSGDYGYTLTAELTKQFTKTDDATQVLNAATIDFANGIMNSDQGVANWPEANMLSSLQLTEDGGSQTVVTTNSSDKKGKGEYFIEYGQSATWDANNHVGANKGSANTADSSVTLTVPATTVASMVVGDYEADITWTLSVNP
ncbi:hypothetical protein M2139_000630 [Enterococcus sp. PF1-24]|uniref:WxL domain-containing protein n=1 Tax=unclassified Enterococcus TaxID=2608891 RepID=UPI002476159B|nr:MULTISPECIES: WxL domain-containing protein [unclassified Enterococcus]MDH6363793.1 hypothetical protein [Enterococcus sp. PFB1-1]MDH6400749.1 hypothetical protein [Enterococcus sp. PF1-24]